MLLWVVGWGTWMGMVQTFNEEFWKQMKVDL